MEYKASLDSLCKGLTAMVFLIVIGISSYALRELLNADGDSKTIFIQSGIIFLNVTVIVVSYLSV